MKILKTTEIQPNFEYTISLFWTEAWAVIQLQQRAKKGGFSL